MVVTLLFHVNDQFRLVDSFNSVVVTLRPQITVEPIKKKFAFNSVVVTLFILFFVVVFKVFLFVHYPLSVIGLYKETCL